MSAPRPGWRLLALVLPLLAGCFPDLFGGQARDADGDGVSAAFDCDDRNPSIFHALPLYLDEDGDGFGTGDPVVTCLGAGGPPPEWALGGGDCAPRDPLAWRHVAEIQVDRDGDGATVAEAVDLCVGADPAPGEVSAPLLPDCDDADPARTTWTVLYPDADGDGLGAGPRAIECLGATRPGGFAVAGLDGDDADPAVGRTFDDGDLQRLLD